MSALKLVLITVGALLLSVSLALVAAVGFGNDGDEARTPDTEAQLPAELLPVEDTDQIGSKVRDGDLEFWVKSFRCGLESIEFEGPLKGDFQTRPAENGQFCVLDFGVTNVGRDARGVYSHYSAAIASGTPTDDGQPTVYPGFKFVDFHLNDFQPPDYCRHQLQSTASRDCRAYFDLPLEAVITQIRFRNSRNSILKIGGVVVDLDPAFNP